MNTVDRPYLDEAFFDELYRIVKGTIFEQWVDAEQVSYLEQTCEFELDCFQELLGIPFLDENPYWIQDDSDPCLFTDSSENISLGLGFAQMSFNQRLDRVKAIWQTKIEAQWESYNKAIDQINKSSKKIELWVDREEIFGDSSPRICAGYRTDLAQRGERHG